LATADITIRGAGIFGLSIAWACAQRGARVRVIDPRGVAAGASGGIVGALAPHTPDMWDTKKEFQFQSLIMAADYWAKIDATSGLSSGYGRLGRLQSIPTKRAVALAKDRRVSAADLWRGQATWDVIKAGGDWAPQSDTGFLIHDTLSGRIHPKAACTSLARALRRSGVEITSDEAPINGPTVWATGYEGFLSLSENRPRVMGNGVKGQAILLKYDAGEVPQLFSDGVHIIPHADGTVAVGSTSERYFDDPTSTDEKIDDVLVKALTICPALQDAPILTRWAGVRPRARTRAPMLGAWPERPNSFIANGGFKIGFGMAPKVGDVMADLVLDGRDTIPDGFRFEDNY